MNSDRESTSSKRVPWQKNRAFNQLSDSVMTGQSVESR